MLTDVALTVPEGSLVLLLWLLGTAVTTPVAFGEVVGAAGEGFAGKAVFAGGEGGGGDGVGVVVGEGGTGTGVLRLIMVSFSMVVLLARSCPLLLGFGRNSTDIG